MFSVWTGAAHHAEGVARLVGLLDSGHGSPHARSRAAITAAIIAGHRGRLGPHSPWSADHDDQAIALCEQALHEARRSRRRTGALARHILTQILMDRGDIDAAARRQLAATPTGSEQTSETDAVCIITDAWFDIIVADLDKATTRLQQVVTRPYRNAFWIGTAARWFLGEVMLERGDHDRARSWIAEALVLGETNGDPDAIIEHTSNWSSSSAPLATATPPTPTSESLPNCDRTPTRSGTCRFSRPAPHWPSTAPRPATPSHSPRLRSLSPTTPPARSIDVSVLRLLGDAEVAAGDLDLACSTSTS